MLTPKQRRRAYRKALRHWSRPEWACKLFGYRNTNLDVEEYFRKQQGIERIPNLPELLVPNKDYVGWEAYKLLAVAYLRQALEKVSHFIKNYT